MYYTTIPFVSERPNNRHWDASKLCKLWKKLDSGMMTMEETDQVASDFLDGEIVNLASDWLGNTVIQKLFEKCSSVPRFDENGSDSTQLTSARDKARQQYVFSLETKTKRQGRISTCRIPYLCFPRLDPASVIHTTVQLDRIYEFRF
ncbi:hypothetical protein EDB19DRAFT_1833054 [Suillus lakei]|nr:hypothetical protein EDB19DRAFT_1833054 [Suillus lakei]